MDIPLQERCEENLLNWHIAYIAQFILYFVMRVMVTLYILRSTITFIRFACSCLILTITLPSMFSKIDREIPVHTKTRAQFGTFFSRNAPGAMRYRFSRRMCKSELFSLNGGPVAYFIEIITGLIHYRCLPGRLSSLKKKIFFNRLLFLDSYQLSITL